MLNKTNLREAGRSGWILVLVLLVAFGLRLYSLPDKEMWYDEAFAVLYAENELGSIVYGTITPVEGAAADIHPLLYYFFLHGWMGIGQSPFLVRFPSVVFGLVSICLLFRIAKELFDAQAALLAATLAAISPFHIWYSQEARMYSLLCLLSLLSIYLFVKAGKSNEWRHWIGFGLCTGVALYVHNLAFLIIVALDLVVLLRRRWALLRRLVVAHVVSLLLFLPWLLLVPGQFAKVRQAYWIPRPGPTELVRTLIVFNFNLPGPNWALPFTLFFSLLLLALTLYRLLRRASPSGARSWATDLGLSLSFVPVLTMFAISQIKPVYIERALLASALLYYVTVARAMLRSRLPRLVVISLIPVPLLLVTSLWYQYNYAGFPRSPFREANAYLSERYVAGDVVVHDSKLSFFPSHYYDRGLAQEYVGDVPGSPTDTLALPTQEVLGLLGKPDMSTAVGDAERVWFVVFQRALDEAAELGEVNRNMAWLEDHYRLTNAIGYGDLSILVYE
ncbi:MAG TPA: glycosyltransferase family 39 protein [Anaerolineae bacterium]|nr:glycosyltransferase family 39 protein [Anaerolineae bacterium]